MLKFNNFIKDIGSIITDNKINMYEYKVQGLKIYLHIKNQFLSYPLKINKLI